MYLNILKSLIKRSAILTIVLLAIVSVAPSSFAEPAKVKDAMSNLKEQTSALGAPSLDGENLMFGTTKINGDFTIVDSVKEKFGGTATLFAKKDTSFVRVSTNVIRDGNRATGTVLDPTGPVYKAINEGKTFYGTVEILGKFFDTGYEPIKNAAGEIIGIYYVGYPID